MSQLELCIEFTSFLYSLFARLRFLFSTPKLVLQVARMNPRSKEFLSFSIWGRYWILLLFTFTLLLLFFTCCELVVVKRFRLWLVASVTGWSFTDAGWRSEGAPRSEEEFQSCRIRFAGWNSVRRRWNLVAEPGEIERIGMEFSRENEERKLLQNEEEEIEGVIEDE